jgi:hypothetical protein
MQKKKNILIVAKHNQTEALRVATGLTLLDDRVKVDVLEKLADTPQVAEQMEVLEFADIPLEVLNQEFPDGVALRLARHIMNADVVFVL